MWPGISINFRQANEKWKKKTSIETMFLLFFLLLLHVQGTISCFVPLRRIKWEDRIERQSVEFECIEFACNDREKHTLNESVLADEVRRKQKNAWHDWCFPALHNAPYIECHFIATCNESFDLNMAHDNMIASFYAVNWLLCLSLTDMPRAHTKYLLTCSLLRLANW